MSQTFSKHKISYTVAEAIAATGVKRTSLYKAMKKGALVFYQHRRKRLFLHEDLVAFITGRSAAAEDRS